MAITVLHLTVGAVAAAAAATKSFDNKRFDGEYEQKDGERDREGDREVNVETVGRNRVYLFRSFVSSFFGNS